MAWNFLMGVIRLESGNLSIGGNRRIGQMTDVHIRCCRIGEMPKGRTRKVYMIDDDKTNARNDHKRGIGERYR